LIVHYTLAPGSIASIPVSYGTSLRPATSLNAKEYVVSC